MTAFGLCGRIDAIIWMASEALGVAVTTFSRPELRRAQLRAHAPRPQVRPSASPPWWWARSPWCFIANVRALAGFFVERCPEIAALTAQVMWYVGPFYVVYSLYDNIAGTIRGAGESLRPMLIVLTGSCLLRVVWQLAVVPLDHTLHMALLSYPITWVDHGRGVHPLLPPRALDGPREGAQGGQPGGLGEKGVGSSAGRPQLSPGLSPRRAEDVRGCGSRPGESWGRPAAGTRFSA